MTGYSVPASDARGPSTFQSRGIAAPFTTPQLAAARVRESARSGIELVMPNPSTGKGRYVLTWAGIQMTCAPTVHDTRLFQALSLLPALDPRTVRDTALTVALEGHAGHAAAAAAKAALAADRAQRLRAQFLLLSGLLEGTGAPGAPGGAGNARSAEFDRLAGLALQRLSARFGRPPAQLAAAIAGLSEAFGPVGVAPDDRHARLPRLIEGIEDAHTDLSQWFAARAASDFGALGQAIAALLATAAKGGRAVIDSTRAVLADPAELLRRRIADPRGTAALAERAAWLLDGWERICMVWRFASGPSGKRLALLEMAECLAPLPSEALDWSDPAVALPAPGPGCRVIPGNSAWRGGSAAIVLTERNETFRAMSL